MPRFARQSIWMRRSTSMNYSSIGYIEFNGLVSSSDFSALERGFDCQFCKAVQIAG